MPAIKEDPTYENNSLVPQCKRYDICGRDAEGDPAGGLRGVGDETLAHRLVSGPDVHRLG